MEEYKDIGERGKTLNLSSASRAMNVDADEEQIEKFDEYEAKKNPLQYITMFLMLVFISLSIYLFKTGHWVWGGLLIFVILFLAMLSRSFGKTTLIKRTAYESGLIISAIIVETSPIKIIALADMRSSTEQKLIWGCQKVTLKNLPNHDIKIGERVPCISLFGMAVKGYRRHFEPRPISWGYKNKDLIAKTTDIITHDNDDLNFENEWVILEKLATKMKTDLEKETVFFDENLNKIEL